jgi:hypothetical protein
MTDLGKCDEIEVLLDPVIRTAYADHRAVIEVQLQMGAGTSGEIFVTKQFPADKPAEEIVREFCRVVAGLGI